MALAQFSQYRIMFTASIFMRFPFVLAIPSPPMRALVVPRVRLPRQSTFSILPRSLQRLPRFLSMPSSTFLRVTAWLCVISLAAKSKVNVFSGQRSSSCLSSFSTCWLLLGHLISTDRVHTSLTEMAMHGFNDLNSHHLIEGGGGMCVRFLFNS